MPQAIDLTPENRFMGLFVSKSGCGKTVAECSFPPPIEVLDFDGRIRGLLGAPWIDRSKISYEFYLPKERGLIEKIDQKLSVMQLQAQSNQLLTKTLVLDSLTSETFAILQQSIPLTHSLGTKEKSKSGKYIGSVAMPGPEDYGIEAVQTYSLMAFLRTLPIPNIIVSAHIVDRYGKVDSENPYSESIVVGEKLSVRDKISENVQIYFDHCFRFDKREVQGRERYFVKFRGDLPTKTAYEQLPNGEVDITGKNFYEVMMGYVRK